MPQRRLNQIAKSIRVLIQMSEKYSNECASYDTTEKILLNEFIDVLKVFNKQSHPTENKIYRGELKKQINQAGLRVTTSDSRKVLFVIAFSILFLIINALIWAIIKAPL